MLVRFGRLWIEVDRLGTSHATRTRSDHPLSRAHLAGRRLSVAEEIKATTEGAQTKGGGVVDGGRSPPRATGYLHGTVLAR